MHDSTTEYSSMILSGRGQVSLVPDLAILRIGVETSGENILDIQNENASISQAVLQSLGELGITDIKTYDYSINKVYEYENGKRIDKGYSVRNILEIKTTNLNLIGTIIDTTVYYGANIIDFIQFDVLKKEDYYLQALNLAVENAIKKAYSIARNLDLVTAPTPIRIVEMDPLAGPTPIQGVREGFATTPIEPGNKQIEANVNVEFRF